MSNWVRLRRVYGAVLVLAGLCIGLCVSETAYAQKEKKGQKSQIVEVDLSKLPPDLAKRLQEVVGRQEQQGKQDEQKGKGKGKGKGDRDRDRDEDSKKGDKKKGTGKTLTLAQAIGVAEKLTKGTAYRAEVRKQDGGATGFRIEIQDAFGKRRIDLSPTGEVLNNDTRKRD